MNITSHAPVISAPTVANPATDALRRDNHQKEVISQPAAANQSAAEKGVASERERARTPAQNNEQVDFENIRKQAELANRTISDEEPKDDQNPDQKGQNGESTEGNEAKAAEPGGLDHAEQQIVNELQQRDREVRSHEMAHASAGGATTGAPSYSFETGPDGKKYAVEGEVSVDLSPVQGNPRATIAKMQKVYNAALAPANPSIQDTRVANSAAQLIAQAQSELLAAQLEEPSKASDSEQTNSPRASFSGSNSRDDDYESDFDRQIRQTLDAQERIAPSRPNAVDERAIRIETFYHDINRAFAKAPSHQFELTA